PGRSHQQSFRRLSASSVETQLRNQPGSSSTLEWATPGPGSSSFAITAFLSTNPGSLMEHRGATQESKGKE
ncbi:hypothetical protein HispidOSU_022752, partial [Sigmodon hispidus]